MILRTLITLIFSTALIHGSCQPESPGNFAFVGVNVLPMTGEKVLNEQTVIVRNGRIHKIGPAAKVKIPKGFSTIDGKGKFLMPGLSEMHAHIPVAQNGNDSMVKETLLLYLSNGITVIRGMLGNPYHLELKKQVASGNVLGPRIYTSSPSLNGNSVPTKEEARAKVAQYAADGYDFLKIHPGIQLDVFGELVSTAREKKITFSGHVPTAVGVHRAIDFGYASIDHLDGYVAGLVPESAGVNPDEEGLFGYNFTTLADIGLIPGLVRKTKDANIWIVPTQSLLTRWLSPKSGAEMAAEPEMKYVAPSTRFQWRSVKQQIHNGLGYNADTAAVYIDIRRKLLKEMHESGVGLLMGSDAPQVFNVPGFSIQHEIAEMAAAGIPNYAILESGTANPARFFGAGGEFGTIVKGASADLLLLEGNPLDDLSFLKKQAGVMIRGQWLPKEWMDRELGVIAEKYSE
jgi:hypothetical protein